MERIIIISDEAPVRSQLTDRVSSILGENAQIKVMSGKEAALQIRDADLTLLHTRLSRVSSLELAKKMREANPASFLVFFSENLEDADFILNSEFDSFLWLNDEKDRLPEMVTLFARRFSEKQDRFIRVKRRNRRQMLPKDQILYVERDYRKIIFHMENGGEVAVYQTMDEILKELDQTFLRTHNSFVVQQKSVRELHRDFLKLKDGSQIPVSRTYSSTTRKTLFPEEA